MTKDEVMNVVEALGDIAGVLHHADPEEKAGGLKGARPSAAPPACRQHQPADSTVRAEVNLDPHQSLNHPYGEMVRVRGGT